MTYTVLGGTLNSTILYSTMLYYTTLAPIKPANPGSPGKMALKTDIFKVNSLVWAAGL